MTQHRKTLRPFLLEIEIFHFKYCRPVRLCVCCVLCVCNCLPFLRFILGLRYFTQGTLGTFSRGTYFVFSKFSNLTPRSIFDLFYLLFKKRCHFLCMLQILSFFWFIRSWGAAIVHLPYTYRPISASFLLCQHIHKTIMLKLLYKSFLMT